MTSSSSSTTTVTTSVLPDKYNYVDLFKDLLDLSSPETRANLLYIGDYKRNADEMEYVMIWTSLAVTLTEEAIERDIYLPKPGMPLFQINDHLTNNFWYEVTYRSLRMLDSTYEIIRNLFFTPSTSDKDKPFPHKGSYGHINDANFHTNLSNSFGCHRVIQFFMENTELQQMIQRDMGYTADDMKYDIDRIHILYAFVHAYRLFNNEKNYKLAARYFKEAQDLWKQIDLNKKDKLGQNFDMVCNRCIYVSLGYHHFSSADSHTKYALIARYFGIAHQWFSYQDPEARIPQLQKMMKSSCLPHKNASDESLSQEIDKEINNLISTNKIEQGEEEEEELTLEGSNPDEKYAFRIIIKQQ